MFGDMDVEARIYFVLIIILVGLFIGSAVVSVRSLSVADQERERRIKAERRRALALKREDEAEYRAAHLEFQLIALQRKHRTDIDQHFAQTAAAAGPPRHAVDDTVVMPQPLNGREATLSLGDPT